MAIDPVEELMARDLDKELADQQKKLEETQNKTVKQTTADLYGIDLSSKTYTKNIGKANFKEIIDPKTGKKKVLALNEKGQFLNIENDYAIQEAAKKLGYNPQDVVYRGEQAKSLFNLMTTNDQQKQAQIDQINRNQNLIQIEKNRQTRLGESLALEQDLRSRLASETEAGTQAVDSQLSRMLEDVGIQAGEAKQNLGQNIAGRGLSRSSFAQKGYEDITTQEIQGKGELRAGAEQQKYELQQNKIKVENKLKQIQDERKRTFEAATEGSIIDEIMKTQQNQLQETYSKLETNAQISAAEREAHQNLLGTIGKGLASVGMKIFSGGVL